MLRSKLPRGILWTGTEDADGIAPKRRVELVHHFPGSLPTITVQLTPKGGLPGRFGEKFCNHDAAFRKAKTIPPEPFAQTHGHFYPATMVKALALVWLFSGIRRNEITRLRVGCIRWQDSEEKSGDQPVCFLHVPVNKTGTAFSRPVDGVVGRAVELWEQMRPPQPASLDLKTGEQVHRLFSHRGRGVSPQYINHVVIPLLCRKAAVALEDTRGRISSHRARATIASQLYNAKEPLSLFELQEWLGHSSPESTRHYAIT